MIKSSRSVLSIIQNMYKANNAYPLISEIHQETDLTYNELLAAIHDLVDNGYLDFTYAPGTKIVKGVTLKIKGIHPIQYKIEIFKGYVVEKWIDFLALIVAIISLIISLIAIFS